MTFQLVQFCITSQVVPNSYCAVLKASLARGGFLARYVQFICVVSQAAANRAPVDESGTKVGRCHTIHTLKCQ